MLLYYLVIIVLSALFLASILFGIINPKLLVASCIFAMLPATLALCFYIRLRNLKNLVIYPDRVEIIPTIGGLSRTALLSEVTGWSDLPVRDRNGSIYRHDLIVYLPQTSFTISPMEVTHYEDVKKLLTNGKAQIPSPRSFFNFWLS